ncbi:MAG: hypothetical protein RMJ43_14570 [Chloroherpetonaceae bacterium]|nr:hypothetical protein [Chthonomonadaceae bacterium]MDW8209056.1 hypothetical protein [Chloroherpetonaceae bacterium]
MTPADLKVIEAACARRQHPIYYDGKNSSPPPLFYRGQHLIVEILVASDGHLARFRIPALLNLYDARDPHAFARKLLELNDQNKRFAVRV